MKITCNKQELISILSIVAKAVDPKPQTPILSGIYLKAEAGKIELHSTNYEMGLIGEIEATVDEEGAIVIPGRYFQEVVRKLPGESVSIALIESEMIVSITSAGANFRLRSMNAADYPTVKKTEGTLSFTVKSDILRSLIKKTAFACSRDEARPVFTGCSLIVSGSECTMAATNAHRLAVKEVTFPSEIGEIKLIVPSKILNEVEHTMSPDVPTDVLVTCSHNAISFSFDDIFMTSRLIEGQFPDYTAVIPKDFSTVVTVNRQDFAAAVDRVSLISRSNNYNIIRFGFADGSIHIFSDNPDIGKAEETIEAAVDGPALDIAFNANYIIDVLSKIEEDKITINLGANNLSPALIKDDKDPDFLYVVTPVRTQN